MKRLVAIAAALALLASAIPAAAGPPPRPNIVVLMTDDQTVRQLEVMGQTRALIGARGTSFRRAIVSYPLCCPARATFLTGLYAHNHGVIHNAGPFGGIKAFDTPNSLPVWLHNAGYRTIQLGRYLNGYGQDGDPAAPPGWDSWHATMDPGTYDYYEWRMSDNGVASAYPEPGHAGEHQTDYYARRAAELVDDAARSDQPFFLNLWFTAPHSGRPSEPDDPPSLPTPVPATRHRDAFAGVPLPRPPSFDEADVSDKPQIVADRQRLGPEQAAAIQENYQQELESLSSVDDAVAAVYAALKRSGELDDTLIVFTSDNGFMHGEHRIQSEKVVPYEESIRVPLLMRGPGVPRGRQERRLVPNVDLAATILDVAGATAGRIPDGRSLLPLLRDRGLEPGRDVLLEDGQGANGIPAYRGLRTYRFKYIEHLTTGEFELYDLKRDPYELRSLDATLSYQPLLVDMRRRLRRLARCAGSRCRARPSLKLRLSSHGHRKARRSVRCVRRVLRLRVAGAESSKVLRADVLIGRRRVARMSRRRLARSVPPGHLRPGRRFLLRVRTSLRDGRVVTLDRRLRACR